MDKDTKKNFLTLMMAKADQLTDFQIAFLDMARFLEEKKISGEFLDWTDKNSKGNK